MKNCAIVTYTNSSCKDVWPIYFGQLKKHAPNLKSYVISDVNPNIEGVEFLEYNNSDPYYVQWLNAMKFINEEYIIYAQEDFIVYDDVDFKKLESYIEFLKANNYSYVRPIRCGFDSSLVKIENNLYDVNQKSDDIFQMQITLWKKQDFVNVYEWTGSVKWFESPVWREVCRELNIKGAFTYYGEPQRGKYHYDSSVFPYVCTAVSRGKWNMNEYPKELGHLFSVYNVDPLIRGIRKDYNYGK
jgi:hypothetical protein